MSILQLVRGPTTKTVARPENPWNAVTRVSIANKLRKRRRLRNAVKIFATGEKVERVGERTQR